MIHAVVALVLQVIIGLATNNWWAGAALGIGIYMGREHAQAEYRWIERYGLGVRANMPWWGGLDKRVWNVKSVLDIAFVLSFTTIMAIMVLS